MTTLNKLLIATASSVAVLASAAAANITKTNNNKYTIERVTFESNGQTLVGNLYIPNTPNADAPNEAVVVTGAWTTIKEQMPATYAQKLAEEGYMALAFDFRTWGESSGETRSLENPELKIADIAAAGQYLSTRPDVSTVNGLGICASSGYMATAAERTDIFDSVALVAPWLHDQELVNVVYGGTEGVNGLIETGRQAAETERSTGEPQLVAAAGPIGSDALMPIEGYYIDPDRGFIPEWENTFNLASWEGWLTFDGIRAAPGIEEPVLIVHSDAAAIPSGAREFYANLTGQKNQVWLDDVTQFDFYDRPDAVEAASKAAAEHFARF